MNYIFEWLSEYNVEYDASTKILYIKKSMPVKEFSYLRWLLQPYMYKIEDIIIEGND